MTGLYKVKYIMDRVKLYINFTIKEGLQKKGDEKTVMCIFTHTMYGVLFSYIVTYLFYD
jgi:hypothetical protein